MQKPAIHCFKGVSSALDTGFELIEKNRLPVWDSVLTESQTQGRGRMRKHWQSPAGNIYAALRLPSDYPYDSSAGPVAVSALCAQVLRKAGFDILIKWPNDLILMKKDNYGKVGGILLEDRKHGLLAGIGININSVPPADFLVETSGLKAACLEESGIKVKSPFELWCDIVKGIYLVHIETPSKNMKWLDYAQSLLLWKDLKVEIRDGREKARGIFLGIDSRGGAVIDSCEGEITFYGGTMRVADNNS